MASRAHVIHEYPFARQSPRPRRQVWYRSSADPVVLPRGGSGGISAALVVSALIASSVIAGGAYAVYFAGAGAPAMVETPAAPVDARWEPDIEPIRANVVRALQGPVVSVPSVTSGPQAPLETDTPSAGAGRDDYFIDDSKQLIRPEPQPVPRSPDSPRQLPYPNPTTTPPDAVAPPDVTPEIPTPALDPENPYRN